MLSIKEFRQRSIAHIQLHLSKKELRAAISHWRQFQSYEKSFKPKEVNHAESGFLKQMSCVFCGCGFWTAMDLAVCYKCALSKLGG